MVEYACIFIERERSSVHEIQFSDIKKNDSISNDSIRLCAHTSSCSELFENMKNLRSMLLENSSTVCGFEGEKKKKSMASFQEKIKKVPMRMTLRNGKQMSNFYGTSNY